MPPEITARGFSDLIFSVRDPLPGNLSHLTRRGRGERYGVKLLFTITEQDRCIHSVCFLDTTNKIVTGMTLHTGLNVLRTVNNATAAIEACLE